MITHLQGRLVEKTPTSIVIDVQGLGYEVNISLHTYSLLSESENVRLYTHLQVKEDAHVLYGFVEKTERELFRLLISVSGVGTSTARTMLSSLSPKQLIYAIANSDVATIQSAKGIGVKTAQRIVIELKEKVLKIHDVEQVSMIENNRTKQETLSALEVLGFNKKQAEKVVDKLLAKEPEITVENLIKQALKNM
ncbi:MAG: Holliday junction branch migration protein RuvA [Bacteroidota bacterium]|nr:Holliday junction branch migration protein RuvA [Bacteroidota bacterium]